MKISQLLRATMLGAVSVPFMGAIAGASGTLTQWAASSGAEYSPSLTTASASVIAEVLSQLVPGQACGIGAGYNPAAISVPEVPFGETSLSIAVQSGTAIPSGSAMGHGWFYGTATSTSPEGCVVSVVVFARDALQHPSITSVGKSSPAAVPVAAPTTSSAPAPAEVPTTGSAPVQNTNSAKLVVDAPASIVVPKSITPEFRRQPTTGVAESRPQTSVVATSAHMNLAASIMAPTNVANGWRIAGGLMLLGLGMLLGIRLGQRRTN